MLEFLDALEGLGCLLEAFCALARGVAVVVRWVASPFRRRKALTGSKPVVYGGRKRP